MEERKIAITVLTPSLKMNSLSFTLPLTVQSSSVSTHCQYYSTCSRRHTKRYQLRQRTNDFQYRAVPRSPIPCPTGHSSPSDQWRPDPVPGTGARKFFRQIRLNLWQTSWNHHNPCWIAFSAASSRSILIHSLAGESPQFLANRF